MCGEQSIKAASEASMEGSPPRVRGTVNRSASSFISDGITPACAGNRSRSSSWTTAAWDHPRVCGEQVPYDAWARDGFGSPPRVRGTVARINLDDLDLGITPACAGNSRVLGPVVEREADHPRVCGEQPRDRVGSVPRFGSPPRVRGTVRLAAAFLAFEWITPACAGNSTYAAILQKLS